MIGMVFLAHVGAGLQERLTHALGQFLAEPGCAFVFDQEGEASASACGPRAVIAEDQRNVGAQLRRFSRTYKYVDRRGRTIASGPLLAADQTIEAVDLMTIQLTVLSH